MQCLSLHVNWLSVASVTHVSVGNAVLVTTCELLTTEEFIRAVPAILASVTHVSVGNAVLVTTCELLTTEEFIRAVPAILASVTHVSVGNAVLVTTCELAVCGFRHTRVCREDSAGHMYDFVMTYDRGVRQSRPGVILQTFPPLQTFPRKICNGVEKPLQTFPHCGPSPRISFQPL